MKVILLRSAGYFFLCLISVVSSNYFFTGSDSAKLAIFVLTTFLSELIIDNFIPSTIKKDKQTNRKLMFIGVVTLLAFSGFFLIEKSMDVRTKTKIVDSIKNNFSLTLSDSTQTRAIAINNKNEIIAISGGMLEKVGYSKNELIGLSIDKLIPDFNKDEFNIKIIDYKETWIMQENQSITFQTKDGKKISMVMTVVMGKLSNDKILNNEDVVLLMLAEEK